MEKIYGYVRVSSREQNEERQLIAMKDLNIPEKNIFLDKQSGKDFNRPNYKKLLKTAKSGDTIYIQSIDRLGRNYREILEQWRIITNEKGMPLLDTRNKGTDLTGIFISELVLQILSYVAETEREFIKKRQAEVIAAAKARGVCFGPKKKPLPDVFFDAKKLWEQGELTIRAAAKRVSMTLSTFYTRCKETQNS